MTSCSSFDNNNYTGGSDLHTFWREGSSALRFVRPVHVETSKVAEASMNLSWEGTELDRTTLIWPANRNLTFTFAAGYSTRC